VPVLSQADGDASWTGARGLVTEKIPELLEPDAHAYLCGPPGMIDSAIALLEQSGVTRKHIHFDRFTTQADVAAAERRRGGGPGRCGPRPPSTFFTT
jgi:ferredoxin-NADP reductase